MSVPELALLIHLLFNLLLHKCTNLLRTATSDSICFSPLLQHKSEFMNAMSPCSKNVTDLSQNLYGHCGTSHITSVDTAKTPFAEQPKPPLPTSNSDEKFSVVFTSLRLTTSIEVEDTIAKGKSIL